MRRVLSAGASAILLAGLLVASADAEPTRTRSTDQIRLTRAGARPTGPLSAAAARALREGSLPADQAALEQGKADAAATAPGAGAPPSGAPPVIVRGKQGISNINSTPSDSTGAIGTQRYIETINIKVGIYDRNLNLINEDSLENWWDAPGANVFDPQVIWDPTTNRFYYAGDAIFSATENAIAFGFSKTAAPNNATTNWCHYFVNYGSNFPDFPKLGDSKFFFIIGVNVFAGGTTFSGSDILAIGKPPAGTTCPDASTFAFGVKTNLQIGANQQFTPVPANEIDTNRTGWVLTRPAALPASTLGVFKVTRNASGAPVFDAGRNISVPNYTFPANAPQQDTSFLLDTSDARLTQGVAAVDPSKGGKLHVWTQHAIAGGAGSMERWYEINPVSATDVRRGNVSHNSLFVFNGAISPDRVVNGSIKKFGKNMILGFTTSSSTTYPAIQMVGKRGGGATSAFRLVKNSPGHNADFSCPGTNVCRWGDYSAATPDPRARRSRPTGTIYLTNMWTADADTTGGTSGTSWRTWNWTARP